MQLLFNHLSSFSYMVTEQTSIGPDLSESEKSGATDEALLVKVCTEPEDTDLTVERAFEELEDV
ncbi:MAG: hypothetical protein SVU32_01590, partial [Candidatus Nanohaloarchaea archaeon]|nr:hypothetical protein [Candidatus Nanohaloarchaea archaeon]